MLQYSAKNPNKSDHLLQYKTLNQISDVAEAICHLGLFFCYNYTWLLPPHGEISEIIDSINNPVLKECKHYIFTTWLTECSSKCSGRQSQWIWCAARQGVALLFVSHEARGPQRVRRTSCAYWGRQVVFTWIFPSLCQDARVRSKDSVSFFVFFSFFPRNIENNLSGPIQEICFVNKRLKRRIHNRDWWQYRVMKKCQLCGIQNSL